MSIPRLPPSVQNFLSSLSNVLTCIASNAMAPTRLACPSYYNGITGDGDHPDLVYRLDFLTTPFPKPVGRHAHIPVKSLCGVFDTPLNSVWDAVGPQIRDLINA